MALDAFQEVEDHFEYAKKRILKMAINQLINGEISQEIFHSYLKRGELAEIFLRDYAGINPTNPILKAAFSALKG